MKTLAALAFLLAGHARSDAPARPNPPTFLPFGFMTHNVPVPSLMQGQNASAVASTAAQARRGFNIALPYLSSRAARPAADRAAILAYLDRCDAVGIRVVYDLTRLTGYHMGELPPLALLTEEVKAVGSHPAVVAWHLADEPDCNGMALERVVAAKAAVRALSELPVAMCFCSAGPTGGTAW